MKMVKAGMSHCELLATIHAKTFDKSWNAEAFQKLLVNTFNTAIIATTDDGDPMGFILFQQVELECEILTICTMPDHRRKGVAKALLKEIDAKRIFLEVAEDNLNAINLYENLGFEIKQTQEKYYKNGKHALLMEKEFKKVDF